MIGPRNVHPDELGEAEGMDIQDALRVGNRLVEAMDEVPLPTDQDFVDNVMATLADEPTPGSTGFLVPLRRRGILGGFRDSFRQAWASVGAGRPIVGRSAALAYVLAVVVAGVSLTGAAALGTAGALGIFNATPTESPTPPVPTAVPPTVAPSPSENAAEPTVGPMPSRTESDDDTDDPNNDDAGPGGGGDDDTGSDGDVDSSGPGGNSGPGSSGSGSDGSRPGSNSSGGSGSSGPG
jgi:uncharacterized membrane protein YgcG